MHGTNRTKTFSFRIFIVSDLRLKAQASKQRTQPDVITIWQTYPGRLEKTGPRHTQALMVTGLSRVVMELICKRRFSYCQKRSGRPEVGTSEKKCPMLMHKWVCCHHSHVQKKRTKPIPCFSVLNYSARTGP